MIVLNEYYFVNIFIFRLLQKAICAPPQPPNTVHAGNPRLFRNDFERPPFQAGSNHPANQPPMQFQPMQFIPSGNGWTQGAQQQSPYGQPIGVMPMQPYPYPYGLEFGFQGPQQGGPQVGPQGAPGVPAHLRNPVGSQYPGVPAGQSFGPPKGF